MIRNPVDSPGASRVAYANVEVTPRQASRRSAPREEGECRVVCVNDAKVAKARAAAPDVDVLQAIADRFGALADPTRLRILLAQSRAELCVCDLANVAARSMPATSQQLKLLRALGLVKFRMQGKLAYYSLADEWVRAVLGDAVRRCGGDE